MIPSTRVLTAILYALVFIDVPKKQKIEGPKRPACVFKPTLASQSFGINTFERHLSVCLCVKFG